ncbi:hypothetical protein PSAB6_70263 [Paraburkholderia sabiae]|nr:hypothetical protein PSAB6_70263 [Paraburkholderia sabiae]
MTLLRCGPKGNVSSLPRDAKKRHRRAHGRLPSVYLNAHWDKSPIPSTGPWTTQVASWDAGDSRVHNFRQRHCFTRFSARTF